MTKQKKGRLSVSAMPSVLDGLSLDLAHLAAATEDVAERRVLRMLRASREDWSIWWVSRAMAALAYDYCPELPAWDWHVVRPSTAGVLVWEGSSGFATDAGPVVQGILWVSTGEEAIIQPLVHARDAAHATPSRYLALASAYYPVTARDAEDLFSDPEDPTLHAMVGATMLLAQTPTVAARRTRISGSPSLHPQRRPEMPFAITQVTLRENVRDTHHAEQREQESRAWQLKHRHLVRGHWKTARVGPGRSSRKPVFVPPYIRGPEGAEFRSSTRVHVWRR